MPKLAHSLNRPVFVVIPTFFGDNAPRPCVLVDIEVAGLWFSGEAVNEQLRKFEDAAPPAEAVTIVFFPFNQIVYVFDPAQFAYLARGVAPRDLPTKRDVLLKRAAYIFPSGRPHAGQSKQKNSNRKR